MKEVQIIRIVSEKGVIKTCFVEDNTLIFEAERTLLDNHNEALAFEMGLCYGLGISNPDFNLPRINMTQEEFEALQLKEAPWCGLGPRTRKKKTS